MKKLLTFVSLLFMVGLASAQVISTNLVSNGVYLLSTNRASVYSIEIASTSPSSLAFFDCDSVAAPWYGTNYANTNGYWNTTASLVSYASNMVTGAGWTNWWTNYGIATVSNYVAATTNRLNPLAAVVGAANTYVVYNTDALFTRGISVLANPATNVSIVINYRTAK